MANFFPFHGNCPGSVNKDAKYRVKHESGKYVIGIYYWSGDGEIWYPISEDHSELVDMVNAVKINFTGTPGGAFYINEYRQVLVPVAGDESGYYYAGEYHKDLVFIFEGKTISGNAVDFEGKPITPGDPWPGPHPGIPYTLAAGGKDIFFRYNPRPRVEKEVRLSKVIGGEKTAKIAKMIAEVKGNLGGRFYVNEYCQVFTPRNGDNGVDYIYVGKLPDLENWFLKPHMGEHEVAAVAESPESKYQAKEPELTEKTIQVIEGEIGHSYASLLGPYLRGTKMVRVVDPYIRENHQIRNFRDFCSLIESFGETPVDVRLHTKATSAEEKKDITEKLDNIKSALAESSVNFSYYFKGADHDRWIKTDTGWKIILGRGLDMFKPPETMCGFEEMDQSLRSCREFYVTYTREKTKD